MIGVLHANFRFQKLLIASLKHFSFAIAWRSILYTNSIFSFRYFKEQLVFQNFLLLFDIHYTFDNVKGFWFLIDHTIAEEGGIFMVDSLACFSHLTFAVQTVTFWLILRKSIRPKTHLWNVIEFFTEQYLPFSCFIR